MCCKKKKQAYDRVIAHYCDNIEALIQQIDQKRKGEDTELVNQLETTLRRLTCLKKNQKGLG